MMTRCQQCNEIRDWGGPNEGGQVRTGDFGGVIKEK